MPETFSADDAEFDDPPPEPEEEESFELAWEDGVEFDDPPPEPEEEESFEVEEVEFDEPPPEPEEEEEAGERVIRFTLRGTTGLSAVIGPLRHNVILEAYAAVGEES